MTLSPTTSAGLDLVLFHAGGLTCAVEASLVVALRDARTAPPAIALAELLDLAPASPIAPPSQARRLCVRQGHRERWLAIDEPVRHQHAPAAALYPLPPLVATRCRIRCVRALAWLRAHDAESLAILLDPRHLPERAIRSGKPLV
ncbi:hypothetical protein ABC977_12350 [Thioalkalicoccus limnaeus]|uniref:CheW-like domain-containing protein n=1 Tax=Thioalkalicoccus limnaeus TaxID=120681 RepID=A0ABV4BI85_9GAMM